MKPQTSKEVIEDFTKDAKAREFAKSLLEDDRFKKFISAICAVMHKHTNASYVEDLPHKQTHLDGGRAALNQFLYNMNTLPYKEPLRDVYDKDEYIPPTSSILHS